MLPTTFRRSIDSVRYMRRNWTCGKRAAPKVKATDSRRERRTVRITMKALTH